MELIQSNNLFREAIAYLEGRDKEGNPHDINVDKAEAILNQILNFNVGNEIILYALGSLHTNKGHFALGVQLLSQVTAANPTFGEAWNNLGLAFKSLCDFNKAEKALKAAAKYCKGPQLVGVYCNLAAINLNRNRAELALQYVERALELDPQHPPTLWHKGLALLELRRWEESAWEYHEYRLRGGAAKDQEIALRNYHGDVLTPVWDGKSPGLIVIHGEQGLGDEIMFASCIADALKTPGCKFIFEPAPRMEAVFRRAFPNVDVYGTHDMHGERWIEKRGKPDYKIGLGSLPKLYRTSAKSFPGTPYLVPNPEKRAWWGDKLRALGKRPNIGIAWQGGVASTRFDARSFHPLMYAPLFQNIDANWISLQYDSTAQLCVNQVKEKLGVKISHWPKAVEQKDQETGKATNDLDDLVALISKLDLVISVCQTAIHVAGALGVPCICLTPSEPSWRYGAVSDESMPWYSSVKLIRQEKETTDWAPVIARAMDETKRYLAIAEAVKCQS